MRYLRRISNYLEIIVISNLTHMMSMADLVVVGVEKLRINGGHFSDKEFTKLIRMNP